jgi:hypothetical protein
VCVVWVWVRLIFNPRFSFRHLKAQPPLPTTTRPWFASTPSAHLIPLASPSSPTHIFFHLALSPLHSAIPSSAATACRSLEAMAAPDAEALAADIICSLRGADLAGWTPPWCKPAPSPAPHAEGELVWPAVARGKRSRRSSPSAGTASGKKRWGRGSPASPLDYSGGSGSGASTSGGEDGGFCWPPATNKVRHRPWLATRAYTSLSRFRRATAAASALGPPLTSPTTGTSFCFFFLRCSGLRDETAPPGQRKSLPFVSQSRNRASLCSCPPRIRRTHPIARISSFACGRRQALPGGPVWLQRSAFESIHLPV